MSVKRFAVCLLLARLVTAVPAEATTEVQLAALRGPTPVSAYGDYVAWSRYDIAGRAYRLTVRSAGRTWTPRIRSRSAPFDVDLGPIGRRRVGAIYSRCSKEPALFTIPLFPGPRAGCRLFLFDLRNRREVALPVSADAPTNRHEPAVWGRRIAFIGRGRKRSREAAYVSRIDGTALRKLRGGGRSEPSYGAAGPTELDMDAHHVAYMWRFDRLRCPGETPPDFGFSPRYELWVDDVRGSHHRLIERGGCSVDLAQGSFDSLFSPNLVNDALTWGRKIVKGTNANGIAELDLRTGTSKATTMSTLIAVARTGHHLVIDRETKYDGASAMTASEVVRLARRTSDGNALGPGERIVAR